MRDFAADGGGDAGEFAEFVFEFGDAEHGGVDEGGQAVDHAEEGLFVVGEGGLGAEFFDADADFFEGLFGVSHSG